MKKLLMLCISILVISQAYSQKYITKTGNTEFSASVPAFEPVEAVNNSTTAVLNTETGEVASLLFIKAFNFEIALMQEHFNENYMDSDIHPKATFKGKIQDWDPSNFMLEKTYKLIGKMNIKGIEKEVITEISLTPKGKNIKVNSSFVLLPKDFNIEIPSVVRNKIAEEVNITLDYELEQKK